MTKVTQTRTRSQVIHGVLFFILMTTNLITGGYLLKIYTWDLMLLRSELVVKATTAGNVWAMMDFQNDRLRVYELMSVDEESIKDTGRRDGPFEIGNWTYVPNLPGSRQAAEAFVASYNGRMRMMYENPEPYTSSRDYKPASQSTHEAFTHATDAAVRASEAAAEQIILGPLSDYEVRIVSVEGGQRYYCGERLVLLHRRRDAGDTYVLHGHGGELGHVVIKPTGEQESIILFRAGVNLVTKSLPDAVSEWQFIESTTGEQEVYVLTSEAVRPADGERYRQLLVEQQTSRTYFNEIFNALQRETINPEP